MEVKIEIGKKPRGNFRCPVNIVAIFTDEEMVLNPLLNVEKLSSYKLPDRLFLGAEDVRKRDGSACRTYDTLEPAAKFFKQRWWTPGTAGEVRLFPKALCGSTCSHCQVMLPWRPGKPDYSDFVRVLRQFSADLIAAWNAALAEAEASEEYEECLVVSDVSIAQAAQAQAAQRVSRKLRVSNSD